MHVRDAFVIAVLCVILALQPCPVGALDYKYYENAPLSEIWHQLSELLVAEGGFVHPTLRLVETKIYGLGLNSTHDLEKGVDLLRLPRSAAIITRPLLKRFEREKEKWKDRQTRMNWMRLLAEASEKIILTVIYGRLRAGLESDSFPLLSPLQKLSMLYWPKDCVSGLNTPDVAKTLLPKYVQERIQISRDFLNTELAKVGHANISKLRFGLNDAQIGRAYCHIGSRIFTFNDVLTLLPLVDYINHCGKKGESSGLCQDNADVIYSPNGYVVRTKKFIPANSQVFWSYSTTHGLASQYTMYGFLDPSVAQGAPSPEITWKLPRITRRSEMDTSKSRVIFAIRRLQKEQRKFILDMDSIFTWSIVRDSVISMEDLAVLRIWLLSPDHGEWSAYNIGRILAQPFHLTAINSKRNTYPIISFAHEARVRNYINNQCQHALETEFEPYDQQLVDQYLDKWKRTSPSNHNLLRTVLQFREEMQVLYEKCLKLTEPKV